MIVCRDLTTESRMRLFKKEWYHSSLCFLVFSDDWKWGPFLSAFKLEPSLRTLEQSPHVCQRCRTTNGIKWGHGRQRSLCKNCHDPYTTGKTNTFERFYKRLAELLLLCGWLQNATARFVGCSFQTDINGLREFYTSFVPTRKNASEAVGKMLQLWSMQELMRLLRTSLMD